MKAIGITLFLLGALAPLTGCARDKGRVPVHPVRGRVVFKDMKPGDVTLVFHALAENRKALNR